MGRRKGTDVCLSACVYKYVRVHAGGGQTIKLSLPSPTCNTHSGVITQCFLLLCVWNISAIKGVNQFIGFVSL